MIRLCLPEDETIIHVEPRGICEHSPVHIQSEEIERVSNFRYLGVHADGKLDWSVHVDAVCVPGSSSACISFLDSDPSVPEKRFSACTIR